MHGNLKPVSMIRSFRPRERQCLNSVVQRNILIDSNFNAAICDFALSEIIIGELTDETTTDESHAGVRYGAPELLAGEPCTRESDVYTFACVVLGE